MAILYPVYKQWNNLFFDESTMELKKKGSKSFPIRFKKNFEFRTRLPRKLKSGDKVYIYEPLKHSGSGMVVGEFTVGKIIPCGHAFGAYDFIHYFCKNVLKNDEYADKFLAAIKTDLPGYKKGYILKWALDEESMDHIKKYGIIPDICDYVFNPDRLKKLDEAEEIWEWCDDWLTNIGFYNEMMESNYKFAYEVINPVRYDTPKSITDFTKTDGSTLLKAPQSFCYVV